MTRSKKDELINKEAEKRALLEDQQTRQTLTTFILPTPSTPSLDDKSKKDKTIAEYYKLVLDAYINKFNKKPEKDGNGNALLRFNRPEEATSFFKELAEDKIPFFVVKIDALGKLTGDYKMSYGDGHLHEGKVAPDQLNQLHQQYNQKMLNLKQQPKNKKHLDLKEKIKKLKDNNTESPDSTQDDSSTQKTAPNPFDTGIPTPKP